MSLSDTSATRLVPVLAGLVAAFAIATTWTPMMREASDRDAASLARQLETVVTLEGRHIPIDEGSEAIDDCLAGVVALAEVDEATVLDLEGRVLGSVPARPIDASGRSMTDTPADHCTLAAIRKGSTFTSALYTTRNGIEAQAACGPIFGPDGQPVAVLAVAGGADYRERLASENFRAFVLLLTVGLMAGLVVVVGLRWLLGPLHEAAEAADRIAEGESGVRVLPRGPKELRRLTEAVNALAGSVEARQDEVEGRLAIVQQLASMVAHEVRNPLQSLSLLCTLARTEPDPETRDRLLSQIEKEIHVLEGVVQRFLRNSGPLQISRAPTDVVALVNEAVAVAEPQARARQVLLLIQAPARLMLDIDGSLVRRALENLLLNAIEFAARTPPGQVTASVVTKGGHTLLVVDDDGPGVPPEDRARIFQPYFSTKGGGTGLGLALVKQVFDAHGGYIRCDDSPLGGARFIASFPSSQSDGGAR